MRINWLNSRFIAILPFIAVVLLYATYGSARNSFFFCKHGGCYESIPENVWKVFKLDSKDDTSLSLDHKETLTREIKTRESTALTAFSV